MDLAELYKWTAIVSGVAFLVQLAATLFGFDDIFGADFCSPALTTVAALRVRESTGPRPRRQRTWTPTPPAS